MVNETHMGDSLPIRPVQSTPPQSTQRSRAAESFDAVIRQEIDKWKGVKFSAHAIERLNSRNIRLTADDRAKIVEAIDRAQMKGSNDSLVLVRGAALVVSVKNRTVVTVLDREEMRGNVFTNIDSAVVMDGEQDTDMT